MFEDNAEKDPGSLPFGGTVALEEDVVEEPCDVDNISGETLEKTPWTTCVMWPSTSQKVSKKRM